MNQYRVVVVGLTDLEDTLNQWAQANWTCVQVVEVLRDDKGPQYAIVFEGYVEPPKPEPMRMT